LQKCANVCTVHDVKNQHSQRWELSPSTI